MAPQPQTVWAVRSFQTSDNHRMEESMVDPENKTVS